MSTEEDFREELKLFKIFWDKHFINTGEIYFEEKKEERKFKANSKTMIFRFLQWLDSEGIGILPLSDYGCLAYDLLLETVSLEESKERFKVKYEKKIEELKTAVERSNSMKTSAMETTAKVHRELEELKEKTKKGG